MPHLLVVEDERDLARLLSRTFAKEGYTVTTAATGREARERLGERRPDAVLLDLMLPDGSGLDLCRELKADARTRGVPVLMVTARGEEVDRVVGLELGADDYVTKPYSPRELVLRVKAVLRRAPAATPAGGPGAAPLACGPVALDEEAHRVTVAGRPIELTAIEFKLLADLLRHPGRVRPRAQLLDAVWGYAAEADTRTLDTHVKRLRQKLGPGRSVIETVRGVGYRCAGAAAGS